MFVTERESLRNEKPANKWLSCVALICQTFTKMRMNDDRPLELLVKPLFQVLELCFSADASDDELTCAATQVCSSCSIVTSARSRVVWAGMGYRHFFGWLETMPPLLSDDCHT